MRTLYLILFVLACACFVAAAVLDERHERYRLRLVALGLFFFALVFTIEQGRLVN